MQMDISTHRFVHRLVQHEQRCIHAINTTKIKIKIKPK